LISGKASHTAFGLLAGGETLELPDERPQGEILPAFVAVGADMAVDEPLEGLHVVPVWARRIRGEVLEPLAWITGGKVKILESRHPGFT
jgi:hypothetical protein